MKKATLRNLSLSSIGVTVLGIVFFVISAIGSTASTTVDASGSTTLTNAQLGNPVLALVAVLLFVAAGIVGLIAWIGGLIRTAQLQQWVWFVIMLLIGPIVTLIWSIAGNDTPNTPQFPPQQG